MKKQGYSGIQAIALTVLVLSVGISFTTYGRALQETLICGVVINFEDPDDLPPMELFHFMPFINEWDTYSRFIGEDGSFSFEFDLLYSLDMMIRFRKGFSVYVHPGDSIYLTIDAGMLRDTSEFMRPAKKYIQIRCRDQAFQDRYQDFTNEFYSRFGSLEDQIALEKAQTNLDPSAYALLLKERTARFNSFLDEYSKSNDLSNAFLTWADEWLRLGEWEDLIRYAWLHPMYNDLDRESFRLPDSYYQFLDEPWHNDETLMASSQYRGFLHEMYMHLYREFHLSDLFTRYDSLYKAGNKTDAFRLQLEFIRSNSGGFEQEYFTSRFFSRLLYWKFIDEFEALYDPGLIGREDFEQVLAMEYENLRALIAKPVYAKDLILHYSDNRGDAPVFSSLPQKYPGKLIYVDFWAPWCGPCMAEMPHSKALQKKMEGSGVVFIFLASRCSEKSWKATIADRQLSGEHYLLDDREYALLADTFNIAGIPRYMILDKQGAVVNDNAPRPGDDSLVPLLESLNK